MSKIPSSKTVPIAIMAVILLFDIGVVIRDFLTGNTATAICLAVLGVFLGYRCILSVVDIRKEYKR